RELEKLMKKAGVHLVFFHPLSFSNLGRLNNRDHRKMAIIDGHIGYVGGFGIASEWTGHAQDKKHWRDSGLRVQGPVVNRMQGAFAENWIEDAVHRGVIVKVMVPAASATDSPIVQHASHHHFGTLLQRGVHVFEYKKTLLHQKVIVIDGVWSCIGSTNFDARSFQLNDEVSMAVRE